eukprot:CAMPEP_0184349782 /NCGR_PEP_ID=MMETSP1089-20130417/37113_1 /TAXON_ID=38269 ORGANISM="Gloeochaete wittrockiana, Strain SAG46.84" /NCGR_SAMPLE_ID=MMETSP1089 /ASSEMBLY_ACC=CAM_ASM_000445 /LENGTH=103 /DNA_ID=CAMNT_0026682231 /DNA_START=32 /DNA_END=340 /DNA_ORIENTATION=+
MSWIGRISRNLTELRFVFDPDLPSSKGILDYIGKNYGRVKKYNPDMAFIVREHEVSFAEVTGFYNDNMTDIVDVTGKDMDFIENEIRKMVEKGEEIEPSKDYP